MAAKRKTRNPKSPSTNRSSQQTLKQASETGELETFEEFVIGSDIVEMEGEAMATGPLGRLRSMYAQTVRNTIAELEGRIESDERELGSDLFIL